MKKFPIKVTPFAHQRKAYEFACRLFGLEGGDAVPISQGVSYLMEMG